MSTHDEPRPMSLDALLHAIHEKLPPPPEMMDPRKVMERQASLGPDLKGRIQAICFRCGRTPEEVGDYGEGVTGESLTPDDYVWDEEATLNPSTGRFACDACYIAIGMPAGPRGWTAP